MTQLLYLNILIPLPLSQPYYTYTLDVAETEPEQLVGRLALIPFGKGKTLTGVIVKVLGDEPPATEIRYKRVLELMPYPPLPPSTLQLWEWAASYYMCSIGELYTAAVPSAFRPDESNSIAGV